MPHARVTTDWNDWLNRHGAQMLLLARQWTRNVADAEDAVQDGFVRFWRSRSSARDPMALMVRCIRSAALNRHRSEQRRTRREAACKPDGTASSEPLFIVEAIASERRDAIERCLHKLPVEQREVVVLRLWSGMPFPQIGDALGISPDTAASRQRYALESLRRCLKPELTDDDD